MNQCNRCGRQFGDSGVSGVENSEASRPCAACMRIELLRSQLLLARDAEREALEVLREAQRTYESALDSYNRARGVRLGLVVTGREAATKPEPPAARG